MTFHPRIDAAHAAPALPAPAMPAASDETLINRIATGDRLAMQALFERHQVRVYRFALRLAGDRALAEDLLSEVFLEVWRHALGFAARSKVSTWLLAIARHKAISSARRRSEGPLDEALAASIPDAGDDPEAALRKSEQTRVLSHCLGRLSSKHREIVDLVYYQAMAIDEVAQIVGIPQNTVKTRMFHARKQLSVLLADAGIDRSSL